MRMGTFDLEHVILESFHADLSKLVRNSFSYWP